MIIRVEKRERYTIVSNTLLNDQRLSWEARGLAVWLLSKPNDWQVAGRGLIKHSPAGADKVARILRELGVAGYLVRHRVQDNHGRFGWQNTLHERPRGSREAGEADSSATLGGRPPGQPCLEKPDMEKPDMVLYKERLKTDRQKTESAAVRRTRMIPSPLRAQQSTRLASDQVGSAASADRVLAVWRSVVHRLPVPRRMATRWVPHCHARLKQYGVGGLKEIFRRLDSSDFAAKGSWADFEWVIKSDANCEKVLAGKYDNRGGRNGGPRPVGLDPRYDGVEQAPDVVLDNREFVKENRV